MKQWRVETPNSARTLRKTLDSLSDDGWEIVSVVSDATGWNLASWFGARKFTVIAARGKAV